MQKILYFRIDSLPNAFFAAGNAISSDIVTFLSFSSFIFTVSPVSSSFPAYFSYFKIFVPLGKLDLARSNEIEYEIATSAVLGFIIISK